ncbi:helix-turn-helix domain-containing protein [Phyllobacterium leguminum]|uniref:DnaA-like protein n=1 Tax=Phyllobacterium leguminum TaxID=314237 RepID=A0A318TJZ9_9HYPH|nr:helix-turn-helix domain-containing protein [Phyllobacterium leguminum]PYE89620.1 DnaA-like protein [Phyllobacterium leguminum]
MIIASSYRHTEQNPRYQQAVREQQRRDRERREAQAIKLLPKTIEIKPIEPTAKQSREEAQSEAVARTKARWGAAAPVDTVPAIIARVAHRHGFTYDDIIEQSRVKKLVAARFEAMAAVRTAKPLMSVPEIAKWFKRDHTTVINALQKMGFKICGAERPAYDRDMVIRMHGFGWTTAEISRRLRCSEGTIRRMLREVAQ